MIERPRAPRHGLLAAILAAVFFAALCPTLDWTPFTNGMENVNVATAVEMINTGKWIVPTLNGKPRTRKPPVAQVAAAAGMKMAPNWPREISARLPALLVASLTLLAVYDFGKVLGGARMGLTTAAACASCFFMLRYACRSSYDIHLLLWVTLTNAFTARVLIRRQWWLGCIGTGACLGMALMTKGPVALVQTIVPTLVGVGALAWLRSRKAQPGEAADATDTATRIGAIACGLLIAAAIATPWVWYVTHKYRHVWDEWQSETTLRPEQGETKTSRFYDYLQVVPLLFPWIAWFTMGMVVICRDAARRACGAAVLTLSLFLVPVLIASCVAPHRDRYVLPIVAPAAVIIAAGFLEYLRQRPRLTSLKAWPEWVHWGLLAGMVIGLPLAGATRLERQNGQPWYSLTTAAVMIAAGVAIILICAVLARRRPAFIAVGAVGTMLLAYVCFSWAYGDASNNASARDFALKLAAQYPTADFYHYHPQNKEAPLEMNIYLNRPVYHLGHPEKLDPGPKPKVLLIRRSQKSWAGLRAHQIESFAEHGSEWDVFVADAKRHAPTTKPRKPKPATRISKPD